MIAAYIESKCMLIVIKFHNHNLGDNMRLFIYAILSFLIFVGCKDSKHDIEELENVSLEGEGWIFNTQYIKAIDDSSWEKLSISALNNYKDFKIDLSFISTGKPQTCGLYAKGVLVSEHRFNKNKKHAKKFLLSPNLIPNTKIWLTQESSANTYSVILEISDMVSFIGACGDAHQYVVGKYEATK